MTRTHSFIRARIMLGFLMLSAISFLPSVARAQNCGDQGSPPVQVSVSVSPGSIIAWSGVTTLTETLNCTVASNSSIAWGAGSEINGGGFVQQADPANPCQCIPAGSSSGTIQLYGTQVTATAVFTIRVAYGAAQAQTTLTVNPLVATISISPSSLVGASNQTAVANVSLNAPVIQTANILVGCPYPGCSSFSLSGSGSQIPPGGTSCTQPQQPPRASDCVTITAEQVSAATTQTFSATYSYTADQTTTTATALPNTPKVSVNPSSVLGGLSQTLTAAWTLPAPAGPSGGTMYLYIFYPPPGQTEFFGTSVIVPSGKNSGTIQFPDPGRVTQDSQFTVEACYITLQDCASTPLTVTPPITATLSVGATSVAGGGQLTFTVTLNGPAPSDLVISISGDSSSPLSGPSSIVIPQGATSGTFTVSVGQVSQSTSLIVTITNPLDGTTSSATFTVTPPPVQEQLVASLSNGSPETVQVTTAPITAHFPLGATFTISIQTTQGDPIPATYSLGPASLGAGVESSALFPGLTAFLYVVQPDPSSVEFQAVHLGTVPLKITPGDTTIPAVQVNLITENPASLGQPHPEVDAIILPLANKTGILPQYLKGQMQQESGAKFNPLAYRYEPLASWVGDYGEVSQFGTTLAPTSGNLRTQPPYSDYILAAAPDLLNPVGLPRGSLILPADIASRVIYNTCCDSNGNVRPLSPTDAPPDQFVSIIKILSLNNAIQNWSTYRPEAFRIFLQAYVNGDTSKDFTAQTSVASSYGYMQMMYVTAISKMHWAGIQGGAKNPSYLFDSPENRAVGGGSFDLAGEFVRGIFRHLYKTEASNPLFNSPTDLDGRFVVVWDQYNNSKGYGTKVLGLEGNYLPVAQSNIFQ